MEYKIIRFPFGRITWIVARVLEVLLRDVIDGCVNNKLTQIRSGPALYSYTDLIYVQLQRAMQFIINFTYIPLTLYPRRGRRGISDIPPRRLRFTKITKL
jgi:hypothetical protein